MGDPLEQQPKPTEIEQLRAVNPTLADEAIALGSKLAGYGVKFRILVPDGAVVAPLPGWNAPAVTTAQASPRAVLDAQPVEGEVSNEQWQSNVRALMTFLSGLSGALGYAGLFNEYAAVTSTVLLYVIPRVWSWHQSKKKAKQKAQQIVTALSLPAEKAPNVPVTPEDVRRITAGRVDAAKVAIARTPVEELIDERIRFAEGRKVVEASPVERVVRKKENE